MKLTQWQELPGFIHAIQLYEQLESRDQFAAKILALFLGIIIVIFGLIMPASNYHSEAVDNYQTQLEDYQWMQANQQVAVNSRGQAGGLEAGQSLLGVANSSSRGFQISFKRYEPVGENGLSLWIEDAVFNNLILWLERLDKRYKISVQEISVERLEENGKVNVRLVLQG